MKGEVSCFLEEFLCGKPNVDENRGLFHVWKLSHLFHQILHMYEGIYCYVIVRGQRSTYACSRLQWLTAKSRFYGTRIKTL